MTKGPALPSSAAWRAPPSNPASTAITARAPVGQPVQFHVRDAATADEDLRLMLGHRQTNPAAALAFSCNGRGTRLFDQPHHDAKTIRASLGSIPLAGFFAMGE